MRTQSAYGKLSKAFLGDIILISIRFYVPNKKIKKGNLFKALVIRNKSYTKRSLGFLNFFENSILLLDKKMQPVGTKIFGPIARESRFRQFNKLSVFAKFVL